MAGEFAKLLPFTWRGLHLPVTRIQLSIAHDLVEHKYWGVDGARVEDTGVAPIRISATIPIGNSIAPAPNEKWVAGKLYPHALRTLIALFAKRSTGKVQHPEFGEISCKAERLEFELSGERQDSTEVRASWVETIDDDAKALLDNVAPSPINALSGELFTLGARYPNLKQLTPTLPKFKEDFASLGRKVTAIFDSSTASAYRQEGVLSQVLYQVNRVERALQRRRNAKVWPGLQSIQIIKAAVYALRRSLVSRSGGVGLYVVPNQTTLAGVALSLPKGTPFGQVISMNPQLVRAPVVPKGAVVRYPLAS